ncbi:MAG: hypothetical protein NTW97_08585 [Candidatus Krumholzibacteria bacterium]|nr:hypothetical protein [Candidatus Krumholzibacteria bacterium]
MEIIAHPRKLERGAFACTAVTIGVFDGVHRGHTEVIRTLAAAKRADALSASILLTFDRHPLAVTHPETAPPLLTTLSEKLYLLGRMDVDYAIVEHFSPKTASIDYRDYIADKLVATLGMKHLVVGYDFRLGRAREGSQERLVEEGRRLGFAVTIVPPMVLQGSVLSSTRIRRDIVERRLDHAARCLGRPANAGIADAAKLLPPGGVYAVEVEERGGVHGGMMNIGIAPTMHADGARHIEIHLFDFDGDLYGELIRVHCRGFIRDEHRFGSADDLRAQLMHDRQTAYTMLEKKH